MLNKYSLDENFIACDCRNEILRITYEPFLDEDGKKVSDFLDELEIAIYSLSSSWSIRNRLRYIWKIIKDGRPYNDQIMLDRDQVQKLTKVLTAYLEGKQTTEN